MMYLAYIIIVIIFFPGIIFTSLEELDFRKQIFLYWSSFCRPKHLARCLSYIRHPINVQVAGLECVLSRVWFIATSWTVICQALLPMELSRQEILEWVALSYSRGSSRLKDQIWSLVSSALAGGFFITEPPGKAKAVATS